MQEINSPIRLITNKPDTPVNFQALAQKIRQVSQTLGFTALGICRPDAHQAAARLEQWISNGYHGEMNYMAERLSLRTHPEILLPEVRSIITVSLPYLPQSIDAKQVLANKSLAYISRYALGRDYHKVVRQRLKKLALSIEHWLGLAHYKAPWSYRVFSDSAPVMEVEYASQSGIAWRGKHTLSLTKNGSWHFLGEIYTTLPLPTDREASAHCGNCVRCIKACPTGAIIAPYQIDARRCISYLTIELAGSIPESLRPLIGNRIYGCDDCQLYCPWNRFALPGDAAFNVRHGLDTASLAELFTWDKETFENKTEGSPIRRIGHERWLRNIAIALGNAGTKEALTALKTREHDSSALVREHVAWGMSLFQ